jgi:hypothetical protein
VRGDRAVDERRRPRTAGAARVEAQFFPSAAIGVGVPLDVDLVQAVSTGVWGLGFGVWGLGFGVWGLGFGVWGLGFGFRG